MDYKLGLIGFPIKHSLSPWIHEYFLQKANLTGTYSILEIPPEESFEEQINTLKNKDINGFNVTVPYKQKIISYLDEIDRDAEIIGAVNTILNRNGKWVGYNTDGIGYLRSLESKYPNLFLDKTKRILLIGAGGAARGIYYALVNAGFNHIDIANRTTESALEIAKLKGKSTTTTILSIPGAEESIGEYDVIIQTTSVGMKPAENKTILSVKQVKETSIVSDIVYQPLKTTFLKQAEKKNASIHLGHTMLLYQAQYAFEIWTDKLVPIDEMDNQLRLILEGR